MGRLKPTLILGGPGCGKTTALLDIVEKAFERGVEPDRIAFVAFTRKAAQEARDRMSAKFGIEADSIPYFRTLHSLAFAQLGIERTQILDGVKLEGYAKAEGLQLSKEFVDEFGVAQAEPFTVDDKILNAWSLSRISSATFHDTVVDQHIDPIYAERVRSDFEEWKEQAMLVDFTDMIEKFRGEAELPAFDLLIVDEAQDLSQLQWQMVDHLVEHSKDIYFAGDDDQAIYAWAGADVEHFLHMDADREVLPVSYRLKRNIFDACQKVINLVDDRYAKDWQPHAEGGVIDYVDNLTRLNDDMSEGSWMILSRTNSLLVRHAKWLRENGLPFWQATKDGMRSSTNTPPVLAVLAYENLKRGKVLNAEQCKNVWEHLSPKLRPTNAPLFEAMGEYTIDDLCSTGFDASPSWLDALMIPSGVLQYIRAVKVRGESLISTPRITLSTIHGVKGGEADTVVVDQKLSSRTHGALVKGNQAEYRALFTAMSRARERLVFLDTTSAKNYGVGKII